MKKILVAIIALTVAMVTSASAGGVWDMIKNTQSDGTLESKQYTIEVAGVNTRGYVINVPDMKSVCFITYSEHGIPAMACKTYKEIEKGN